MAIKTKTYARKFGINYITCVSCNFVYDTQIGNFDLEIEALELAERLHNDNSRRCRKNRNLIVEIVHLRYEN